MKRELFEKRKEEFKKIVLEEGNLPKVGMRKFSDRDDARIWFNKIYNSGLFNDFISEINNILSNYGLMVLDDKDKEEEFLETINIIGRIPFKGELYFSDNDEMYMWYFNHKVKKPSFETLVHNNLKEKKYDKEYIRNLMIDNPKIISMDLSEFEKEIILK